MGFGSLWHWLIVLVIVLVLFGRGRVSEIMGDFGKGINSFKKGLSDSDAPPPAAPVPPQVTNGQSQPSPVAEETRR